MYIVRSEYSADLSLVCETMSPLSGFHLTGGEQRIHTPHTFGQCGQKMGVKQLVFFLIFCCLCSALAEPQLSVTGNAYQGSALFVRLTGEKQPEISLGNRSYPVTGKAGSWETVLPLSTDCPPSMNLVVKTPEQTWNRRVAVKTRHYGHQSIQISAATLASYDEPQNKADDAAILKSLEEDREPRHFAANFDYPVTAPQTTGFGLKRTYNGWRKGWHKGLDLAGWEGEPVKAPADGVVLHTARGVVNGNTVVLSHGAGVGTVYLHLNSIQVRPGQTVTRGQAIGTVGGTGGFAPHLHWEARVHGVPVNPKLFFNLPDSWISS